MKKTILFYYYKYKLRYFEFLIIIAMKYKLWKSIEKYIKIRKNIIIKIRKYY